MGRGEMFALQYEWMAGVKKKSNGLLMILITQRFPEMGVA